MLSKNASIERYGPSVGDKVRLADTELFLEVEQDFTVAGEESLFGPGRVVRDGMGQSQHSSVRAADTVVTNALVLDHWGVVKADIGIKDGRILAIGNSGNPDTQPDIDIIIGPGTEIIAAEGCIATPGAVAGHSHFLSPQQIQEALFSGVTTLLGGGAGPGAGSRATGCTPGPWNIRRMLQAADALPVNMGFFAKGSASLPQALDEQLLAGAMGLNLHPDWGVSSAVVRNCLEVAHRHDVPVALQLDSLNESGFDDSCLAALEEQAVILLGGCGETQGLFQACGTPNVLPATSNTAPPPGINSTDEQLDMRMTSRRLDAAFPEDTLLAVSRTRQDDGAASAVLHDLGALSMLSACGQAAGRAGELAVRAWQTAHAMKLQRGPFLQDKGNDNFRARRYLAKYTINPALAHGIAREVGSIEPGKLADIILWKPAFFAAKPALVIKGGLIAAAPLGDPGASVPEAQPLLCRPMFGTLPSAAQATSLCFVSQASAGVGKLLGLRKRIVPVAHTRTVTKKHMVHNTHTPQVTTDPRTGQIRADGELLQCEPLEELPLAQRYFLF